MCLILFFSDQRLSLCHHRSGGLGFGAMRRHILFSVCLGIWLRILQPANCFMSRIASSVNTEVHPCKRQSCSLSVLPLWADIGTVVAQLTIAPAAVYYIRNQMQEEVTLLNQKIENIEQSNQNITQMSLENDQINSRSFAGNMKGAVGAYQKLYSNLMGKVNNVMINSDNRADFNQKLKKSIATLQSLENDILKLKNDDQEIEKEMGFSFQDMRNEIEGLLRKESERGKYVGFMRFFSYHLCSYVM